VRETQQGRLTLCKI